MCLVAIVPACNKHKCTNCSKTMNFGDNMVAKVYTYENTSNLGQTCDSLKRLPLPFVHYIAVGPLNVYTIYNLPNQSK